MKPFAPPPVRNLDLDQTREERASLGRVRDAVAKAPGVLNDPTAAALGPLSVTTSTHQDHWDHWHQLRSEPLPGYGGAEFRLDVPRGRVLPDNPILHDLAEAAPRFVHSRQAVIERVQTAEAIASERLRRPAGPWGGPEITAVGVAAGPDAPLTTILEVRTFGHGLFPIVERLRATSPEALAAKLDALHCRHLRRAHLRASLLADGNQGWIDETTRRILATVGQDAHWAIDRLRERGTADIWFAVDPGSVHARIRWREGVLKIDYSDGGLNLDLVGNDQTLFRLLPAKTLAARIGNPIGRLTGDRFIPPESILFDARRQDNGWTVLTLAIPKTPIPIARERRRATRE